MSVVLFTPNTTKQDYFRRNSVKFTRPAALQVCPFDDATEWTLNDIAPADVTKTTDTTEHPGVNGAAVKLAVPVIASDATTKFWRLYKDFTTPWDARDCTITIKYYTDCPYTPYGSDYYRANFELVLSSDANPITNRVKFSLPLSPGEHVIEITEPWGVEAGTVDEGAIRSVGVYYAANSTNGSDTAFNIWFDSIVFTKSNRTKGAVILSWDDAYVSHLTAAKILHGYGLRSMVYAQPNVWGTGSFMSPTQLRECEKYGMLVCAHWQGTYFDYNGAPQTVASDGAVHSWCRQVKQGMWREGFRNGSEFLALPGGTINQQSEDHINVMRQYFSIIRGTGPFRTQGRAPHTMAVTLDGPAVDKGGGLVGFPAPGHTFTTGMRVELNNTTNYTATYYTVHADTSASEVVVTVAYAAETFNGGQSIEPWTNGAQYPVGNIAAYIHGGNPMEPWWRWGYTATNADDGAYEATLESGVTESIAAKGIFELYDHEFGATNMNAARLATFAAYLATQVAAGTIDVITYEDLL